MGFYDESEKRAGASYIKTMTECGVPEHVQLEGLKAAHRAGFPLDTRQGEKIAIGYCADKMTDNIRWQFNG
ncbi:MAG: hypothetical protein FWD16_04150 [Clostridia bacterium]|nr:hypothetical protein [Clostridia bacterium]